MFGRATIRLGIGPHSSYVLFSCAACKTINKELDADAYLVQSCCPLWLRSFHFVI